MTSPFKKYRMFVTTDCLESICLNTVSVNERTDFKVFGINSPSANSMSNADSNATSISIIIIESISLYHRNFLFSIRLHEKTILRKWKAKRTTQAALFFLLFFSFSFYRFAHLLSRNPIYKHENSQQVSTFVLYLYFC